MQLPKVSIVTITYNHENYILEALNSFLAQKYEGPIEVIIANDNSPDNTHKAISDFLVTTDIPSNFEIKYTNHEVNKGMMENFIWSLQQATGEYIAFCEGDDYWIDELKLQKQVDFLENNLQYGFVSSNYKIMKNDDITDRIIDVPNDIITKEIFLKYWVFQLFTVLIRKSDIDFNKLKKISIINDTTFGYMLVTSKNGFYFNDFFGVYRHHTGGVYSMINDSNKLKHVFYTYRALKKDFPSNKNIRKQYFNSIYNILEKNINIDFPKYILYVNLFFNITKMIDFKKSIKILIKK
jgi:glycosyltransferase involved in cell wall biosynthesis